MARGFLINKSDGSYSGWAGHENAVNRTKFPETDFEFVVDDARDPRVAGIKAEKDAPPVPAQEQPSFENDVIDMLTGTATEKAAAEKRLKARRP